MTGAVGVKSVPAPAETAVISDHPFNKGFTGETWAFGDFLFSGYNYEFPAECNDPVCEKAVCRYNDPLTLLVKLPHDIL